jgi:hypothetical protein
MFQEPEMRMLKTTPKGKYNKNGNMDLVMDEKPEMNVNVDIIIAAVKPNREYEAGIQVHQGEETNMFEEAETGMLKTNSKGKNNVANPYRRPQYCTIVTTISIV